MDVITVQKEEGLTCSLCNGLIPKGTECIRFWSKDRKAGELHFRHFECQYKTKERKGSLEDYIALIKSNVMMRKIKNSKKKNQH